MNKKENKKMGNLKCIAVILALTAMVAGGAARMGAVAGDYIVAVQAAQAEERGGLDDVCGTYYGFVNCRPATMNLLENQRFTSVHQKRRRPDLQTCRPVLRRRRDAEFAGRRVRPRVCSRL